MSEAVGLGEADAESRWIGIRRHQAALIIVGVGLVGDWIIVSRAIPGELVLGLCALIASVPAMDRLTVAEFLGVCAAFTFRQRWLVVQSDPLGSSLALRARGATTATGFELHHRGRLDLSGSDLELSERLVDLVKSLAARSETEHASVHVRSTPTSANTLLTLRHGALGPEGWSENSELLRDTLGLRPGEACSGLLERWSYVRSLDEVIRTYRIRDFNGARETRALLEKLQQSVSHPGISLHFDVLTSARAHRLSSRAVHRMGSDDAASMAAGFRRSARSKRSLHRLVQREEFVASGEALLRMAVFVTVHAVSLGELRARGKELLRSAEESGLRLERGAGRQAPWYCFQLPGGPGW